MSTAGKVLRVQVVAAATLVGLVNGLIPEHVTKPRAVCW
jgi:hypothetical protein